MGSGRMCAVRSLSACEPLNSTKPTRCRAIAGAPPPGASRSGAGDVRRYGPSREALRRDIEDLSRWNHLEFGRATRNSRCDRSPQRSAGGERGPAGFRIAIRSLLPGGGLFARSGLSSSAQGGRQWLSFRKSSIIRAPIGALPGHTRIGGSTTHFRIWEWRAATHTWAKPRKPEKRFRTSSNFGRTPTPAFLFFSKLERSTAGCVERTDGAKFCCALSRNTSLNRI
jgi:hypothetical protein